MVEESIFETAQDLATARVFAYLDLALDSRIWVSRLNGGEIPIGTQLVALNSDFNAELSGSHEIAVSGSSMQDRNLDLVRMMALGFEPYEFGTRTSGISQFEGFLALPHSNEREVAVKAVVQIDIESLFELPLFQIGILDSSEDAISGQPFFQPVDREQLVLAAKTTLDVGDRTIVKVGGQLMCLSLKSLIGDGKFEAILYGGTEMPLVEGEQINAFARKTCGRCRISACTTVGKVKFVSH